MPPTARLRTLALGLAALAVLAAGCGSRTVVVAVPPRIDLEAHDTIGVIDFDSQPAETLNQATTQRFMSVIQESQPGVRFLELGETGRVLQAVGRGEIDPETIKLIGRKYSVDTLFTGGYEISAPKPKLVLDQDFSVDASARVKVTMSIRHWDTRSGATMWTRSRWGEWPIARVAKGSGQPISFDVSDPRDRYGDFLGQLVNAVTDDFRVHYERRKVARQ